MDDEREEELETLISIYPELVRDLKDPFSLTLELAVTPSTPLLVRFLPDRFIQKKKTDTYANAVLTHESACQQVELSHLPPLCLKVTLPAGYPADAPPQVSLSDPEKCLPKAKLAELEKEAVLLWEEYGHSIILFVYIDYLQQAADRGFDLDQTTSVGFVLPESQHSRLVAFDEDTKITKFRDRYPADAPPQVSLSDPEKCLPKAKLAELEKEAVLLWEEYGHSIILFVYIDYLQQAADRGFDLDQTTSVGFVLPESQHSRLVAFDEDTKITKFRDSTVDCGICLEPKKGSSCHQMKYCGHVFCLQCLQDFYNNAITEGDVGNIRCLDPDCGKEKAEEKKRKSNRTLQPSELLNMGIDEPMVRRYVDMKRKKKLEADKTTVYCPRTWCQGPARSKKYPPIPHELSTYAVHESSDSEADGPDVKNASAPVQPDPSERLAVCESCSLAFCRVCFMGWHGPFARCFPRDPKELSAEEKASYDYIRLHTSPCPTCNSPTSKTMGCNHMSCFQCKTHFCYLCGAWLDGTNPYLHFNKPGTNCYQRLWELEGGDDGEVPEDGQGFAGGRGWEQLAMEAAREAEAQDAADEAAARAIEAVDAARNADAVGAPPRALPVIAQQMMQLNIDDNGDDEANQPAQRQERRRHPQNPFGNRRPPPDHAARADVVRLHERNGGGRGRGGGAQRGGAVLPHVRGQANANARRRQHQDPDGGRIDDEEERQQLELQRFLDMAQRDEEDGWDSDELGDEEGFRIR
nr:e3 ubiquitin-protein ligase itt1 [Quercus suber]